MKGKERGKDNVSEEWYDEGFLKNRLINKKVFSFTDSIPKYKYWPSSDSAFTCTA